MEITNEEAIEILENEKPHCGRRITFTEKEKCEAFEMAIAALKAEPCEDCVSRKAVLDLINADWKYENLEVPVANLPPATPKQEWIHVSEDLPKESGEYLVSVIDEYDENYEAVGVARYDIEEGEWQGLGVDRTVIAWMPKPESYREGEKDGGH